ncbi:MAG TPA: PRC-barrel domain-containing protein [Alphaproteobacteria bacterium]
MAKLGESASGRVISASMVQGTPVCNAEGKKLGTVEDIMIDKLSGQVRYAVLGFGGFLGMGDKLFPLPWRALDYNKDWESFVVDIDKDRLENAPGFDADNPPDLGNEAWGQKVYDYYGFSEYWAEDNTRGRGYGRSDVI